MADSGQKKEAEQPVGCSAWSFFALWHLKLKCLYLKARSFYKLDGYLCWQHLQPPGTLVKPYERTRYRTVGKRESISLSSVLKWIDFFVKALMVRFLLKESVLEPIFLVNLPVSNEDGGFVDVVKPRVYSTLVAFLFPGLLRYLSFCCGIFTETVKFWWLSFLYLFLIHIAVSFCFLPQAKI